MQSRVPAIAREEIEDSDDETSEESTASDRSSDGEKSLDEIIDAYAE